MHHFSFFTVVYFGNDKIEGTTLFFRGSMSTFDPYLWFCLQIPTGNPLYESYYKQVSFTGIFLDGTRE